MNILAREELKSLMDIQKGPCASVYISFPPSGEPSRQARIKLKNAVRDLEILLGKSDLGKKGGIMFLDPFQDILNNVSFLKSLNTALAIFVSGSGMRYFWLPVEVRDLVTFSDRFHIKPLIQLFSGEEQYYLLAISQKKARLFRGSRYSLDLMEVEGLPEGLKEALNYEDREKTIQRSHGGSSGITPVHGAGYELEKDDMAKYFKIVDKAVMNALGDRRKPLLLAAVEPEISLYLRVSAYPSVLERGLHGNPDNLSPHTLHKSSMDIMEPFFKEREEKAIYEYHEKLGSGKTSKDLRDLIPMAQEGRIKTFFVSKDHRQWGGYDPSSGTIDIHNERMEGDQDLLDLVAYHTILTGGTVYVVDHERVPGNGLVSAIFRY